MVQDLTMLVDAVAPGERCVLVGHSFGTFIISAYAQQHAALVAGVVLVDPPTEWLTMTRYRALLLWRGRNLSRLGAILAHIGIVRVCLALLTHGAPGAPRRLVRLLGPAAAGRVERLVGEVRKLPSEVHPIVRAHWSDPKCFHAMGSHMRALRRHHATIAAAAVPREIPVVVISGGDQPAEQLAAHRKLAEASNDGRHIVAKRSAHWIQFDQPELIVDAVRELTGSALANELG
jgi:pimeloyl-ACP methyl ester carboxylesterase